MRKSVTQSSVTVLKLLMTDWDQIKKELKMILGLSSLSILFSKTDIGQVFYCIHSKIKYIENTRTMPQHFPSGLYIMHQ